ncbi:glycosyltransferase family 1 protein [Brachybacterium sp. JHP9]|uniref:D-inositol 3-phosphate glycosyltransferase n=1 Tax=Brachybacterium equifaecis TaxID=2910770 RepID=A0ABT0QXR9_9MICO|nr:glycosyltransferase family 1 protein [Brachybacterium equifaecis]MCL6422477.1 glycosyltransferase family 1 protein [Brachybacterium equifaecis]
MRIAIVTETFLPSVDGVVTRLRHAVERFTAEGHEVLVIAPDLGAREHAGARVEGIRTVTLPFYRQRPWALPSRRVRRLLAEFRPDVIHAAQPMMMAASAVGAARALDAPLVASYHTHIPKYLDLYPAWRWGKGLVWWWIRRQHGRADVNVATSQAIREELAAHGVPRLEVVRRGVDVEAHHPRFASRAMRERLTGGHPERTLLVYVGRLAPEKEIQSLRPLLDRREDVALAIVGDGPHRSELERVFGPDSGGPGAGRAVFPGFLAGEELASAFASADAFVFPSVTETLGLVILEGMASGLPVVAARSGPTLEQVADGENGLLYDAADAAVPGGSLDRALDRLQDPELAARIRERARAEAEEWSWDAASDDLLRIYERAIDVHEGRGRRSRG